MSLSIIVLAGGRGTRIKSILGNTPKILAPIGRKTFLDWLIIWIKKWELDLNYEILLSTGIGHLEVENFCKSNNYNFMCIKEDKPLGTFGAIANVAARFESDNYLILNGDTIFNADFKEIYNSYSNNHKPTIVLKKSINNERYGGYKKKDEGWIFSEEQTNFISLGAFLISNKDLKKRWLVKTSMPFDPISINNIDKELMIDRDCIGENPISAFILDSNISFLDIGVPNSYKKSQTYIPSFIEDMKNKF